MGFVRVHASHWRTYLACGGLALGIGLLVSKREEVATRGETSNAVGNEERLVTPKPPSQAYRHYDHSSEAESRTYQEVNQRNSFALNVATFALNICLAFVVSLTLFAAYGSYRESKRQAVAIEGQLREAKKQTVISENGAMPYVLPVIENDKLLVTPTSVMVTTASFPFHCSLSFQNFGISPAVVREIVVKLTLGLTDGYFPPEYHTTDLILEAKGVHQMAFDPPRMLTLSHQDAIEVYTGQVAVYLRGQVLYNDVTGTSFQSQFCFVQAMGKGFHRVDLQAASGPDCANSVGRLQAVAH